MSLYTAPYSASLGLILKINYLLTISCLRFSFLMQLQHIDSTYLLDSNLMRCVFIHLINPSFCSLAADLMLLNSDSELLYFYFSWRLVKLNHKKLAKVGCLIKLACVWSILSSFILLISWKICLLLELNLSIESLQVHLQGMSCDGDLQYKYRLRICLVLTALPLMVKIGSSEWSENGYQNRVKIIEYTDHMKVRN